MLSEAISRWATFSDVDFVTLIALRRPAYPHERWARLPLPAVKFALRSLKEFYDFNVGEFSTIAAETDFTFDFDELFLRRAYTLLLAREPRVEELEFWRRQRVSLSRLVAELMLSEESFLVDGLEESFANAEPDQARLLNRQVAANQHGFDLYIRSIKTTLTRKFSAAEKFSQLRSQRLRIGLNFFPMSKDDLGSTTDYVSRLFPDSEIEFLEVYLDDIIDRDALSSIDILVMNNNNLYARTDELFESLQQAKCVTCCWLWDNHHQFALSARAAQVFDILFPAHSNGQLYIHNGKALVGSVIPCSVFQWTSDALARFFQQAMQPPRSDALYGRFNSYSGRVGVRDTFLQAVSAQFPEWDVKVIKASENRWFNTSLEDRFAELARFKAVLCNPIYNDVPARLFDALVAGCVPVIPYGLPDLSQSFTPEEIALLPIISYIPNSASSLQAAVSQAIRAFDLTGIEGVRRRQQLIVDRHMLHRRLGRMIAEVLSLATVSPTTSLAPVQMHAVEREREFAAPEPRSQAGMSPSMPVRKIVYDLHALPVMQWHFLNEEFTRLTYTKVVGEGDAAIDAGANHGYHTSRLAALTGSRGIVHAFEPNLDLFVELKGLASHIRVWPYAIGDRLEVVHLHVAAEDDGWSSLIDIRQFEHLKSVVTRSTVQVPLDALNELFEQPIKFIKLDVEQREEQALLGMRGLISKWKPVLVCEGAKPGPLAVLTSLGYDCFDFDGTPASLEGRLPNFLALHRSRRDELETLLPSDEEWRQAYSECLTR